jgi:single-strand DNA-binding protein
MSYEMEGTVKVIEETQTFESGFSKKEFVITTDDKYPQDVKFEATKEKIEQVDALSVGDLVNVSFNVRGNEYKGRYYVNLQTWKIDVLAAVKHDTEHAASNRGSGQTPHPPEQRELTGGVSDFEEDVEDCPF